MFRFLCYGRPPYSKHILVVGSSCGYLWHFYIKKITSALALGRRARRGGVWFLFFVYSPSILKLFPNMFPIAPPFNPIFFSSCSSSIHISCERGAPRKHDKVCFYFGGGKHIFMFLCWDSPFFRNTFLMVPFFFIPLKSFLWIIAILDLIIHERPCMKRKYMLLITISCGDPQISIFSFSPMHLSFARHKKMNPALDTPP